MGLITVLPYSHGTSSSNQAIIRGCHFSRSKIHWLTANTVSWGNVHYASRNAIETACRTRRQMHMAGGCVPRPGERLPSASGSKLSVGSWRWEEWQRKGRNIWVGRGWKEEEQGRKDIDPDSTGVHQYPSNILCLPPYPYLLWFCVRKFLVEIWTDMWGSKGLP